MSYKIVYPEEINTDEKKYFYMYSVQEALRLEHNIQGEKFRNKEITEEEWNYYLNNNFMPKSDAIINEILNLRKKAKQISINKSIDEIVVKEK